MLLIFNPDETAKENQPLPSHAASGQQHLAFEVEKADYPFGDRRAGDVGVDLFGSKILDL